MQQRDTVKATKCVREEFLLIFVLGHPWEKKDGPWKRVEKPIDVRGNG